MNKNVHMHMKVHFGHFISGDISENHENFIFVYRNFMCTFFFIFLSRKITRLEVC